MTTAGRQARAACGPTVAFRVAAGPRQGYGHLVRSVRLAACLGVRCLISVRGGEAARHVAERLGATVDTGPFGATLDAWAPAVLVVDDPVEAYARRAIVMARRRGLPTLSVHDLGRGSLEADFVIDGSLPGHPRIDHVPASRLRRGCRFMVVDPAVPALTRQRRSSPDWDVVVSLGGGASARLGVAVARRLSARGAGLRVVVATGLTGPIPGAPAARGRFSVLPAGVPLVEMAGRAAVAVVSGGVTAYEMAALGVPAVVIAVVPEQRPTVRALVRNRVALDGGTLGPTATAVRVETVCRQVERLLRDSVARRRMARAGRQLVDGRGAARVAQLIARVATDRF